MQFIKGEIIIYVKIWMLHILSYYLIYGFIYQFISYKANDETLFQMEFFLKCFTSPLAGAIGLYNGFPAFVLMPIIVMLFFVKVTQKKYFLSFLFSLIISYIFPLIYHFFVGSNIYAFQTREWNKPDIRIQEYFFVLPSFVFSLVTNWMVLRKNYKEISNKLD